MSKGPAAPEKVFATLVDDDFGISRYDGAGATTLGLIQALQRYGSFEEYHFFVNDIAKAKEAQNVLPSVDRSKLFQVSQLQERLERAPRSTVLFLPGFLALEVIAARDHFVRAPLPVCGITYSLNSTAVWLEAFALQAYGCSPGDGLICTSRGARRIAQALLTPVRRGIQAPLPQMETIPSGIHPEQFAQVDRSESKVGLGLSPSDIVLGYFGRISEDSKADLAPLMHIFKNLMQSSSGKKSLKLLISGRGDPPYLKRLEALQRELSLGSSVKWVLDPPSEDRSRIYSAIDIFVFLSDSLHDSFPAAALEAMSCGCAMVVSDWDGLKDLPKDCVKVVPTYIGSSITGDPNQYLSDSAFSYNATKACIVDLRVLRDTLAELIMADSLRRKLGERSRIIAQSRYAWKTLVPRYEAFFRKQISVAQRIRSRRIPKGNRGRLFLRQGTATLSSSTEIRLSGDKIRPAPTPRLGFVHESPLIDKLEGLCADWTPAGEFLVKLRGIGLPGWRGELALSYLIKYGTLEMRGGRTARIRSK